MTNLAPESGSVWWFEAFSPFFLLRSGVPGLRYTHSVLDWLFKHMCSCFPDSIVASIRRCHRRDRGSIPRQEALFAIRCPCPFRPTRAWRAPLD